MDLGAVDRITADAIGEPGMRTFYLQARSGEQLVTVIVEKEQVELLARSVLELATEVPIPDDVEPEELSLEEPVDPRWRVGRLSIGFDDEQDRFLLEIDEFVPEVDEDDEDPRSILPEEPESITLWASREQMLALARHGTTVVAAGGPAASSAGTRWTPRGTCVRPRTGIERRGPERLRPRSPPARSRCWARSPSRPTPHSWCGASRRKTACSAVYKPMRGESAAVGLPRWHAAPA